MNSFARIVSLASASFLLSFAGRVTAQDAPLVTIDDQRTAESLKGFRSSTFSAIVFLGDKFQKPPPADRLRDELSKRATQPLSLVITELRLADFFPVRLKAGPGLGGSFTNSIMQGLVNSKTDWSFIKDIGMPDNEDAIVCVFAGTANGREIKVATFAPYKISAFAFRVDTQKEYKAAFASVYEQTAQKIIDYVGSAQASPQDSKPEGEVPSP